MVLNNFALTTQMKDYNNFSIITCLSWNKKNTRKKELHGK